MLERPFSYVIFDMDGVLLDTEPLYTRATQQVVERYGKSFTWDIKCEMMGRHPVEAAEYLIKRLELPLEPEQYLAEARPLLEQLFVDCTELRGARELVAALRDHGVPMAVATSSSRRVFELKTRKHDFFHAFAAVVCGDDPRIGKLKPAPDIFLVAAGELRARPADCLVVEDSLAGVAAARAASMQVIALPDANNDRTRFGTADWVVDSYADLPVGDLVRFFQPPN